MIERLRDIHGITPITFLRYLLMLPFVVLGLSIIAKVGILVTPVLAAGVSVLMYGI